MSREEQEILELFSRMSKIKKAHALAIFRKMAPQKARPDQQSSSPPILRLVASVK